MGLLMTVKGLALAYNRDLQEDKEPLFDTVDTVKAAVTLMAGLLAQLEVRPERMAAALHGGFLTATDMADYLVTKGLPFRTAHEQVGLTVRYAESKSKELWELKLDAIHQFAPLAQPGARRSAYRHVPGDGLARRMPQALPRRSQPSGW